MEEKAIVLLSGGVDSTVVLALALQNNRSCHALSFDYSQRHRLELRAAQAICRHYNVPHSQVRIDATAFAKSALVNGQALAKNRTVQQISQGGIPSSYVHGRNTIFLSYAMGQAEALEAMEIYYCPNIHDYNPYPDCRPAFIEAFQGVLNVATKQAVEGKPPKLMAPFVKMTKKEIILKGMELKVPLELTLSCYNPTSLGHHCGCCDACMVRREGFQQAGIVDPTQYKS